MMSRAGGGFSGQQPRPSEVY